tara:strand:- start:603 stop:965 length:363 start_codon:yes stop_codon:yes gene_type:complete
MSHAQRVMAFKVFNDSRAPKISHPSEPDTDAEKAAKNPKGRAAQQLALLYAWSRHDGLTDMEALTVAAVPEGWRRCSELRAKGLVETTEETRIGKRNITVHVSRITARGRECLQFVELMQ